MSRAHWLIVHGITAAQWAERHDLEPYTRSCSECGADCTTSIPFAVGQLRGLASPQCACGNERTPYCVVRDARYGDLFGGNGRLG